MSPNWVSYPLLCSKLTQNLAAQTVNTLVSQFLQGRNWGAVWLGGSGWGVSHWVMGEWPAVSSKASAGTWAGSGPLSAALLEGKLRCLCDL